MAATLLPLQGYPFALDVLIDYRLTDDGLSVTTTATNVGDHPCPYGCGQHPYLSPGAGLIDDCTLHLAADTRIVTDPNRELPVGTEPVGGTPHNFRAGKTLNDLKVDYAFTSLTRDAEDRAWVRLTGIDGRVAELWVDRAYPIIEIFTADTLAPDRRRRGLGTEPMSCPPNAFQSGADVVRLEPGQSTSASWGARLALQPESPARGPEQRQPATAACRAGPHRPRPTGASPANGLPPQLIASFDQRIR
jgi:aldose 1-epimerase